MSEKSTSPLEIECLPGEAFVHRLMSFVHALPASAKGARVCALAVIRNADLLARVGAFVRGAHTLERLRCCFTPTSFGAAATASSQFVGYSFTTVQSVRAWLPPRKPDSVEDVSILLSEYGTRLDPKGFAAEDTTKADVYERVSIRSDLSLVLPVRKGPEAVGGFLFGPTLTSWDVLGQMLCNTLRFLLGAANDSCKCLSTRRLTDKCAQADVARSLLNARECVTNHPARCVARSTRDARDDKEYTLHGEWMDEKEAEALRSRFSAMLKLLCPTEDTSITPSAQSLQGVAVSPYSTTSPTGTLVIDPTTDALYVLWDSEAGRIEKFKGCGFHPLARSNTHVYSPIGARFFYPREDALLDLQDKGARIGLPVFVLCDIRSEAEARTPSTQPHAERMSCYRMRLGDGPLSPFYYDFRDGWDTCTWSLLIPPMEPLAQLPKYLSTHMPHSTSFSCECKLGLFYPIVHACAFTEYERLRKGSPMLRDHLTAVDNTTARLVLPKVDSLLASCGGRYRVLPLASESVGLLLPPTAKSAEAFVCAEAKFPVLGEVKEAFREVFEKQDEDVRLLSELVERPGDAVASLVARLEAKGYVPTTNVKANRLRRAFCPYLAPVPAAHVSHLLENSDPVPCRVRRHEASNSLVLPADFATQREPRDVAHLYTDLLSGNDVHTWSARVQFPDVSRDAARFRASMTSASDDESLPASTQSS